MKAGATNILKQYIFFFLRSLPSLLPSLPSLLPLHVLFISIKKSVDYFNQKTEIAYKFLNKNMAIICPSPLLDSPYGKTKTLNKI
jgi:hypothetical protein